jgi:hypothetical protein
MPHRQGRGEFAEPRGTATVGILISRTKNQKQKIQNPISHMILGRCYAKSSAKVRKYKNLYIRTEPDDLNDLTLSHQESIDTWKEKGGNKSGNQRMIRRRQ